jgi:hypothetical protein
MTKPDDKAQPVECDGISAKRVIKTHDARGLLLREPMTVIRIIVDNPSRTCSIDLDASTVMALCRSLMSLARGEYLPAGLPHIMSLGGKMPMTIEDKGPR